MDIKLKQKLGGVTQFILVPFGFKGSAATARMKSDVLHIGLIMLLLACVFETSFAESPQNNLEVGGPSVVNAFGEPSTSFGPEAPPDGVTKESSPQPFGPAPVSDNILPKPNDAKPIQETPIQERPSQEKPNEGKPNQEKPNEGDIVIQLFNGNGFASNANKRNVLMMNIDLIKNVDPVHLRDLMTSNKSIEDIKGELRAAAGATAARGSIGINEVNYPLINIELLPSKNNSTVVDADVAKLHLKPDDTIDNTIIVGHIEVTLAASEEGLEGKGELTMSSDEYNGKYAVLLHMEKTPAGDIPPAFGN